MRHLLAASLVILALVASAHAAHASDSTAPPVPLAERAYAPSTEWVACEETPCAPVYRSACEPLRQAPRKCWGGAVAAYLWAANISGTSYADGNATDIDVDFADLFDALEYAFMGYAEVGYDRFSLAVDASVLGLELSQPGPIAGVVSVDSELTQTLIDLRLGYTVLRRPVGSSQWGSCCYPREMHLDAVVGARYWDLGTEITLTGPRGRTRVVDTDESWWDPYLGARFRWPFAKRWSLTAYGDIGGFGIGDGSELTWQLQAMVRFHITRGFFVGLGYRALDVDRVTGSGATKSGIDATYHGPLLGLGFVF